MRTRYWKLYERTQHFRDAEEMAQLAEQLGRMFEARVFLALAIRQEPERADLRRDLGRLSQTQRSDSQEIQALADVLARHLANDGKTDVAPRGR